MTTNNKRAIWLAVNSEQGERLVEIAREHVRLVKELPERPSTAQHAAGMDPHKDVREIIGNLISVLNCLQNRGAESAEV